MFSERVARKSSKALDSALLKVGLTLCLVLLLTSYSVEALENADQNASPQTLDTITRSSGSGPKSSTVISDLQINRNRVSTLRANEKAPILLGVVVPLGTALILFWTAWIMSKQYELKKRPILTFCFGPRTRHAHIYLLLRNVSNTDAKALILIRMFTKFPGQDEFVESWLLDRAYSQGLYWNASAGSWIEGHKDLEFVLTPYSDVKPVEFFINISICYREWDPKSQKLRKKLYRTLNQRWDFYLSDRRFVPVITADDEKPGFQCIST